MSCVLVRLQFGQTGDLRLTVEEEDFPHPRRRTLYIDEETYAAIGSPIAGAFLEDDVLSYITEAEGRLKAKERAARILAYAPCSAGALVKKLRAKGYDLETAEAAVAYMMKKGYLNEEEQAYRLAVLAVGGKYWGRRRVIAYLRSKGYPASVCAVAIARAEEEGEIDFAAAKARLLEKYLGEDAAPEEKRALLYKYGY